MTLSNNFRSLLFVPASRPERIPKALASGADAVIVDLEDAVAPTHKESARQALNRFLKSHDHASIIVRINAPASKEFQLDLELCAENPGVSKIIVPKAEAYQTLEQAAVYGKPVWPLIETAKGLSELFKLVHVPGVDRLCFGALDMASDLGLRPGTEGAQFILDQCRYELLVASRAAGLPRPVDSPPTDIDDTTSVERIALRAKSMGFTGMLCIHPNQVEPIHRAFAPDDSEIEWAQRVINLANQGESAFKVDGQMVDAPVIARAKSILDSISTS